MPAQPPNSTANRPRRAAVWTLTVVEAGIVRSLGWAMRHPALASIGTAGAAVTPAVTVSHLIWGAGAVAGGAGLHLIARGKAPQRGALSLAGECKYAQRRRRLRSRWVRAMTDAGLAKAPLSASAEDKRVPGLRRIRRTPYGLSCTVNVGRVGATPEKLRGVVRDVCSTVGARNGWVTDLGPSTARLDLYWEDPLASTIRARDLPPATRPVHATIGLTERGEPVEKDLRLPNLIVGAQGAGKSSEVWMILDALQQARVPHRVRAFDPKGGQEFADLEGCAYYYERNPTKWPTFLGHAIRAMEARQADLRKRGLRKNEFTRDSPLDVMIIDELLTALAMSAGTAKVTIGGEKIKASDAFMVFLSQARAAGFTVLACTQLSQKSTIGDIRDLFGYATCLRVNSDEIVNTILGNGAAKSYPAHLLPADERFAGVGFMATRRGVVKYRAGYLTDHERAQVCRRMAADTAYYRRNSTADLGLVVVS